MTRKEAAEVLKEIEYPVNRDNRECRVTAIDMAIETLEQEPRKGHWILTDVEADRVWYCKCSECGKDPIDYISGTENWWLTASNLPNYCPSCGSRNEVEDGHK